MGIRRSSLLLCLSISLFLGCRDWKAEVSSDTKWSGSFGNSTVDGSGNQTVDLPDDEIVCVVVQKETEAGFLKVKIINDSANPFASDGEEASTSAQFGVVSVCSKK